MERRSPRDDTALLASSQSPSGKIPEEAATERAVVFYDIPLYIILICCKPPAVYRSPATTACPARRVSQKVKTRDDFTVARDSYCCSKPQQTRLQNPISVVVPYTRCYVQRGRVYISKSLYELENGESDAIIRSYIGIQWTAEWWHSCLPALHGVRAFHRCVTKRLLLFAQSLWACITFSIHYSVGDVDLCTQ